jgi:hypothetical protein
VQRVQRHLTMSSRSISATVDHVIMQQCSIAQRVSRHCLHVLASRITGPSRRSRWEFAD